MNAIARARGGPYVWKLLPASMKLLQQLFAEGSVQVTENNHTICHDLISRCIARLVKDKQGNEKIIFISPLVYQIVVNQLFSFPEPNVDHPPPFQDFVRTTLGHMSASELKTSLGKTREKTLNEITWQSIFYNAAIQVLKGRAGIGLCVSNLCLPHQKKKRSFSEMESPVVYPDIYINRNFNWLIELTRDSTQLLEHLYRLLYVYKPEFAHLKGYLVLNFCFLNTSPLKFNEADMEQWGLTSNDLQHLW